MHLNKAIILYFFISFLLLLSCGDETATMQENDAVVPVFKKVKILSLGDSYTIGQSVCETCKFPSQLVSELKKENSRLQIDLKVIATTGWTTTNLLDAINNEDLSTDYTLTTLLIGVNNQFQKKPFSLFEKEFPELVTLAAKAAQGNLNRLIVLSIPDYAFTPFGQGNTNITQELNQYNTYIENYCLDRGISFVNITDITRLGLSNPDLVANDGLHPSALAYQKFVERLLPIATQKLTIE